MCVWCLWWGTGANFSVLCLLLKKKDHVKNLRLFLLFLPSLVLNCSGSMLILCRNGYLAKKKGRAEII